MGGGVSGTGAGPAELETPRGELARGWECGGGSVGVYAWPVQPRRPAESGSGRRPLGPHPALHFGAPKTG